MPREGEEEDWLFMWGESELCADVSGMREEWVSLTRELHGVGVGKFSILGFH